MRERTTLLPYAALLVASAMHVGCESDDAANSLPARAPTTLTQVASDGFDAPGDGVASPDGNTFYFTGFTRDEEPQAAIFSVSSSGGSVETLFAGEPLEYPTGLVMSCDGASLFVADLSLGEELTETDADEGAIYSLDVTGRTLTPLQADGITVANALAMASDCTTLHVTGQNAAGRPALFTLPMEGGAASETLAGDPLVSPSGVHVDEDDVAWVVDHLALGDDGPGVLFSITQDGATDIMLSGLRLGAPGGVSLAAGGTTAVVPEVDERGNARLTSVNTITRERGVLEAPDLADPAGIRTAREAGVFVVIDNEGGAIFRAE